MRPAFRIIPLVAALALVSGCDQPAAPAADKPAASAVSPAAQAPQQGLQRSGELLTAHVDAMPRQQFLDQLAKLTGAEITSEADGQLPVTVHLDQASLRQLLATALADAPYTLTLQYANLQDSFPATVIITHYQKPAAAAAPVAAPTPVAPVAVEPVVPESLAAPSGPDFGQMPPEEQYNYFIGQSSEDQVSLVFDMEPTPEESALLARLLQNQALPHEVKMEMLDSLSNGEYRDSIEGLKVAVADPDEEIATKAVEVMGELGSEKDIPMLQKLSEEHSSEAVKQAARDAIDMLSP